MYYNTHLPLPPSILLQNGVLLLAAHIALELGIMQHATVASCLHCCYQTLFCKGNANRQQRWWVTLFLTYPLEFKRTITSHSLNHFGILPSSALPPTRHCLCCICETAAFNPLLEICSRMHFGYVGLISIVDHFPCRS